MEFHFADGVQNADRYPHLLQDKELLDSYFALLKGRGPMENLQLFLDSGAFSAFTKGIEIDIQDYISFIKEHEQHLTHYAVLDAIPPHPKTATKEGYTKSARETWRRQRIMEEAGLNPVPCFHYGENKRWLMKYIKDYDYVALGGMVPVPSKDLRPWLDDVFSTIICGPEGFPVSKIHGFGMTSHSLMVRYPWYSLDSTSWVLNGRFGAVYVPKKRNGEYTYDGRPWNVNVSNRSPQKKEEGRHIDNYSPNEKKIILEYFEMKGYVLGETDKDGEVIEKGVSNHYQYRDELNILYFLDLEASMPEYPWPFKQKISRGLFG